MRIKRWNMAPLDKALAAEMAEASELHPFLALLLTARGVSSPEEMKAFLMGYEEEEDPFALSDMDAAVERIQAAIDNHEKILVYGDYDVDGITATVLLYSYLRSCGADVVYRLPMREAGYGLHDDGIRWAAEQGTSLIVTVDTGISLTEDEIAAIVAAGMDLVITDHHQPPEKLPQAVAVVDPHRMDCESICKDHAGVGVAFMLVCALDGDGEKILNTYGDLLTLGTLADAMLLRGFTRDVVRRGLALLDASTRPGLLALRRATGYAEKPLSASSVNFLLVPRLNAAGRMADPQLAAELLLADNAATAEALVEKLQEHNMARQEASRDVLEKVADQIRENPQWLYDRVLVVSGRDWPAGVLGIAAARLVDQYGKPTIVLTEQGAVAHGSGRSVTGFSLFNALRPLEDILTAFGGHDQAAGLTVAVQDIPLLRERINRYAAEIYPRMPMAELDVTLRLRPDQIDMEKLALMDLLEPFGAGNPAPLFGLFQMRLDNITAIGGGKHLRLSLSRGNTRINVMKFQSTPEMFPIPCGALVNCVVSLEKNTYRGVESVSICARDIGYADTDRDALAADIERFEGIMRHEWKQVGLLPERTLLARLYSLLHHCRMWTGTLEQLQHAVAFSAGAGQPLPSALQVMIALELWREASLIAVEDRGELMTITVLPAEKKVDLTATPLWRYLEEE